MKTRYALSLIAICCAFACGREPLPADTPAPRPVRYAAVQPAGGPPEKTFSGVAQANQETQLSFKVAGTIEQLAVRVGARVAAGALIARLDAADYRIQYDQAVVRKKNAEVQLRNAEAQLQVARSAYERTERLYENNSVSLSDYERARSTHETAQAQVEAARAQVTAAASQLQAAANQLAYTRLKAPFAGIISAAPVEEKENVGAGMVVAVISAEGRPEVSVGIPGSLINGVRVGQAVEVVFPSLPGQQFGGRVKTVAFVADGSSTYPVRVSLDAVSDAVRPGMAASVRFPMREANAVSVGSGPERCLVPPVAAGEDRAGRFVYVLTSAGDGVAVAQRRAVTVGALTNDGLEIIDGLRPGEYVVTAGISQVSDGMNVKAEFSKPN